MTDDLTLPADGDLILRIFAPTLIGIRSALVDDKAGQAQISFLTRLPPELDQSQFDLLGGSLSSLFDLRVMMNRQTEIVKGVERTEARRDGVIGKQEPPRFANRRPDVRAGGCPAGAYKADTELLLVMDQRQGTTRIEAVSAQENS